MSATTTHPVYIIPGVQMWLPTQRLNGHIPRNFTNTVDSPPPPPSWVLNQIRRRTKKRSSDATEITIKRCDIFTCLRNRKKTNKNPNNNIPNTKQKKTPKNLQPNNNKKNPIPPVQHLWQWTTYLLWIEFEAKVRKHSCPSCFNVRHLQQYGINGNTTIHSLLCIHNRFSSLYT